MSLLLKLYGLIFMKNIRAIFPFTFPLQKIMLTDNREVILNEQIIPLKEIASIEVKTVRTLIAPIVKTVYDVKLGNSKDVKYELKNITPRGLEELKTSTMLANHEVKI